MVVRSQGIQGQRQPPCTGLFQSFRKLFRDQNSVCANNDPEVLSVGVTDDFQDVPPKKGFSAREYRQALRSERNDFVNNSEAFLRVEFARAISLVHSIPFPPAGIKIAVFAREVAAVGKIPGDDEGPVECGHRLSIPSFVCLIHRSVSQRFGVTGKAPLCGSRESASAFVIPTFIRASFRKAKSQILSPYQHNTPFVRLPEMRSLLDIPKLVPPITVECGTLSGTAQEEKSSDRAMAAAS